MNRPCLAVQTWIPHALVIVGLLSDERPRQSRSPRVPFLPDTPVLAFNRKNIWPFPRFPLLLISSESLAASLAQTSRRPLPEFLFLPGLSHAPGAPCAPPLAADPVFSCRWSQHKAVRVINPHRRAASWPPSCRIKGSRASAAVAVALLGSAGAMPAPARNGSAVLSQNAAARRCYHPIPVFVVPPSVFRCLLRPARSPCEPWPTFGLLFSCCASRPAPSAASLHQLLHHCYYSRVLS